MARFSFEICQQNQVEELVRYIDEHWAKNHILVTSRTLLDWQHKSKEGNYYNFVMARHNKSGEICGVLGFIPTSHFSDDLVSEREVWLAIWKVNEGPKYIGLGLGMLNFLKKEFSVRNICSIGISQIVQPMYQTLGFEVGKLSQLALINRDLKRFDIAQVPDDIVISELKCSHEYTLKVIPEEQLGQALEDTRLYTSKTQKSAGYFMNRFVHHPVFRYQFFGIYQGTTLVTFLVARVVNYENSSVVRIVDIQGDYHVIPHVSSALHDFLVSENHEYLDIMQYGLNEADFCQSGFVTADMHESLIIPDYFQPFVQKNIPIYFARQTAEPEDEFVLFKGDADQDRPNRI